MNEKLRNEFPSHGWKQILAANISLLAKYDEAKSQDEAHEVQVYRGKVAEAEFRKWLSGFLPKRYGVTSGYVVSAGLKANQKLPHFDCIIYDRLNAPILWIEEQADSSEAGRSMAIPSEYTKMVIEIKSSFSYKTANAAISHLSELKQLLTGLDKPENPYKLYLPKDFYCGIVFYELREENKNNQNALFEMINGYFIRGYFGGLILRGEGHDIPQCGRINLVKSEGKLKGYCSKSYGLLHLALSKTLEISTGKHFSALIDWHEDGFARFAFDIVALLNGTYRPGHISSFLGRGTFAWEFKEKWEKA
jgi:hypothetical protein